MGNFNYKTDKLLKFVEKLLSDFKTKIILDKAIEHQKKRIQQNGYDCGTFACLFTRMIKRKGSFSFEMIGRVQQAMMASFRSLMRKEILIGKIVDFDFVETQQFDKDDLSGLVLQNLKKLNPK